MADYVKISALTNGTDVNKNDYLIFEANGGGTKKVAYKDLMESIIPNNAAAHNGIFRGEDLTTRGVADICNRIADGSFDDLFIGDYFDIDITTPDKETTEKIRYILAGFDMYWNNGNTALTKHHAVIVPKNCFATLHPMNSTNTTGVSQNTANPVGSSAESSKQKGAYLGSDMFQITLKKYESAVEHVLGTHMLSFNDILSNKMVTTTPSMAGAGWNGASTGWEWVSIKMRLMSEPQIVGTTILSSSLYDVGAAQLQLPLFSLNPVAKVCGQGGTGDGGRCTYWTSAVASSASFAYVDDRGASSSNTALSARGVRPLSLIGNP